VARILSAQERRAREVLEDHRAGLEAVTQVLLDRETVEGEEVARLIDEAYGSPVHSEDEAHTHFAKGITGLVPAAPMSASSDSHTEAVNPDVRPVERPDPLT
jgi:hypothetical protein